MTTRPTRFISGSRVVSRAVRRVAAGSRGRVSPDADGTKPLTGRTSRFAYLVLAHRDPEGIARLADRVRQHSPDADVLLAFNGRLTATGKRRLDAANVLRVGSGRPARWGTYSLVERTLEGLRAAREYAWVVLVSGQDYPVVRLREWERRLTTQSAVALMDVQRVQPSELELLNRTRLRWAVVSPRTRAGCYLLQKVGQILPGRLGSRVFVFGNHCSIAYGRVCPPPVVYKGSQWLALSREGVELVLGAAADAKTSRPFRRSFAPDESFVQTVIATSGRPFLLGSVSMTRWVGGAAHPDELGPEDLEAVFGAGTPFARKLAGERGRILAGLVDAALSETGETGAGSVVR